MRVTVQPAADGFDMRQNWVTKKGGKSMPSTKKSAAVRKARELASEGDTLVVKGTDGRIQSGYPRTYRGDYSDDGTDGSKRLGFRDRDDGRDERPAARPRDSDDAIDDLEGLEFRDPVEGADMIRDDFEDNKDDVESTLDDLF